jgi:hypothetical protein
LPFYGSDHSADVSNLFRNFSHWIGLESMSRMKESFGGIRQRNTDTTWGAVRKANNCFEERFIIWIFLSEKISPHLGRQTSSRILLDIK